MPVTVLAVRERHMNACFMMAVAVSRNISKGPGPCPPFATVA